MLKRQTRILVERDGILSPAWVIEHSSMGVLVDWHASGRREMVASDLVSICPPEKWERAVEYGHLSIV